MSYYGFSTKRRGNWEAKAEVGQELGKGGFNQTSLLGGSVASGSNGGGQGLAFLASLSFQAVLIRPMIF